ncbi:hypothetical protein EMIHUDRAFT_431662, partial [Emiliania huxleyi CCMP1516]|uniref:Uncharacterized protein n=2 Tax=Emiliania huxleyi TaxID=2903 RepID=A0A0D3L0D5_EMIH1
MLCRRSPFPTLRRPPQLGGFGGGPATAFHRTTSDCSSARRDRRVSHSAASCGVLAAAAAAVGGEEPSPLLLRARAEARPAATAVARPSPACGWSMRRRRGTTHRMGRTSGSTSTCFAGGAAASLSTSAATTESRTRTRTTMRCGSDGAASAPSPTPRREQPPLQPHPLTPPRRLLACSCDSHSLLARRRLTEASQCVDALGVPAHRRRRPLLGRAGRSLGHSRHAPLHRSLHVLLAPPLA